MSLVRRLLSPLYRRARRAEARGDYREAAALYVEADLPEEAANALLFAAARAAEVENRLAALHDALRWLAPNHPKRDEVEAQIGTTVLEEAQKHGFHTADERQKLAEAAARLERVERFLPAATAYELLERTEDLARCLEKAGEVERLEALLEERTVEATRSRELQRCISDYEMSLALGARVEARAALQRAVDLEPSDASLVDLLRRLDRKMVPGITLLLTVNGSDFAFVGRDRVELGRDADVVVRGTSVSRRHTEVFIRTGAVVVRDLGSRNGTLIRGLPVSGELQLEGSTEIGLGDDVTIQAELVERCLQLKVRTGLDRGLCILVSEQPIRVPGVAATVSFPNGYPIVSALDGRPAHLGSQRVTAPISVLREDTIEVGSDRLVVK